MLWATVAEGSNCRYSGYGVAQERAVYALKWSWETRAMTMSVQAAAQALREATQATVRRYSTWYLIQGVLMVIAGIVAFLYPFVSSAALVLFLGWILIISGIVQGISLIGAQSVPNFWLQLVSAVRQ